MTTQTIKNRIVEYKHDIAELEKIVKEWEDEFRIKDISKLAEACYEAFNSLQMAIAEIKDSQEKTGFIRQCYKGAYHFLTFVENKVDTDFCILLMNKSEAFSKLIKHYSKYCSDVESQYFIELDSEKKFGAALKRSPRVKTVRQK